MLILSRCHFFSIWSVNSYTSKSPSKLFCGYDQTDSKVDMERQKTQKSQYNIEGEQIWRTDSIWLQVLVYKVTVIKTVWYWRKTSQKISGTKYKPETDLYKCGHLIFGKRSKAIPWSEDIQQIVLEKFDIHMEKKRKSIKRPYTIYWN